jgi:hypothetical protein
MLPSEPPAEKPNRSPSTAEAGGDRKLPRAVAASFCWLVISLAVFQFSENTADPDLWGHVVFGQEMLQTHRIPKTEMYSWTAFGQPWINHECLAEISLGGAHALLGGSGLLLLKVVIGMLTFAISLRLGLLDFSSRSRLVAWAIAALAVVEISYGFAARPQIFTALFLALELALLRRIHAGAHLWALALPLLFGIWINTHGGVLAGFGLLGLAALATTAQGLFRRLRSDSPDARESNMKMIAVLWLAVIASTAALFCNPWKGELLRWLIGSVLWLRPEIAEWNPTPLGWDHGALFILVLLAIFGWAFSRRSRAWWEAAACAAFALLALRSVRNAPLCAIVLMALTPTHLADALARFRAHLARLETLGNSAGFQKLALAFFACGGVAIATATFTLHKEHPLTMEAPSAQYPNGAIAFLRENKISGKMLTFFDWGEMVIFHLPDCPPSIDGRLDTCYSRELIAAHWKFFNGEPFDQNILNPEAADLALLPSNLAGAKALAKLPDWRAIYFDDTAVILARNWERFPALAHLTLPVQGPKNAGVGRIAFSDHNPRRK